MGSLGMDYGVIEAAEIIGAMQVKFKTAFTYDTVHRDTSK